MKIVMGVLLMLMIIATIRRNEVWRNEIGLWEDVRAKSPNKLRPRVQLGTLYFQAGRLEESTDEYIRLRQLYAEQKDNVPAPKADYGEFSTMGLSAIAMVHKKYDIAGALLVEDLNKRHTPGLLSQMSVLYIKTGQLDKAWDVVEYGLKEFPLDEGRKLKNADSVGLLINKAELLRIVHRCAEMTEVLTYAAKFDVNTPAMECT